MKALHVSVFTAMLGISLVAPAGFSQSGPLSLTTLYSFMGRPDGENPMGAVVVGKDGVLYGATYMGGYAWGTVYSLTPPATPGGTWTEAVLHKFTGSDGEGPTTGGLIAGGGTLYGTT